MISKANKTAASVLIAATALSGCANSTIHKTSQLGEFNMLALDAKQRLVISGRRPVYKDPKTGYFTGGEYVICSEPSPDALVAASSYAASTFSDADDTNLSAAFGTGEAASSLGVRTQTIQLLRDGYFRICEAYLNGAIGQEEYRRVIAAIDVFMITLVGIQAIGGVIKSEPVQVSAGSNSTSSLVTSGAELTDAQKQVLQEALDTNAADRTDAQNALIQEAIDGSGGNTSAVNAGGVQTDSSVGSLTFNVAGLTNDADRTAFITALGMANKLSDKQVAGIKEIVSLYLRQRPPGLAR
ncbi:hypothetical protein AIOL_002451 [Candidatus Rhodobacter oscarellae]|uniref:Lipoprotein n=1 Tax=Candidatus Rhodobacter oscarellae TaxID=1675527 RepID=A0A0J9E3V8_9RHOB|nr:hypothetical protein [Candidatus Rhodobacter lobularis]KMW57486.1 hypothetical protein AIOL_002451 [Candidatus Rhodobacter lobularis]